MHELSYKQALEQGIEPIQYRTDALQGLGAGIHRGRLDALVWAKRQPALQALITLDSGPKVQVIGFQRHSRCDFPEYLGFRALIPGQMVDLVIDIGIRGGLRPSISPASAK